MKFQFESNIQNDHSLSQFSRLESLTIKKMKPLSTTQKMLAWLCICPDGNPSNRWKRLAHICFAVGISTVLVTAIASSIAFALKNFSIDLNRSLFAVQQTFAYLPLVYMCIISVIMRNEIAELFTSLGKIYDASKYHKWIFQNIFAKQCDLYGKMKKK